MADMDMRRGFSARVTLLVSAVLWTASAGSDAEGGPQAERLPVSVDAQEHDRARSLKQRGAIVSLEAILASARRYHDGTVLESELEQEGGRYIYEIELVDEGGHVWEMKFDASTAELLDERRER